MTRKRVEMSEFDQHIQERMRQAYQRVFGGRPGSPGFGQRFMEPPCDVYQTEGHVVVLMDIAGIPDEEIELEVDGRKLTISGERKPLGGGGGSRSYTQMEITTGPFRRELFLPAEVDAEASEAVYHSGILKITLPISPATGRHLRIIVR